MYCPRRDGSSKVGRAGQHGQINSSHRVWPTYLYFKLVLPLKLDNRASHHSYSWCPIVAYFSIMVLSKIFSNLLLGFYRDLFSCFCEHIGEMGKTPPNQQHYLRSIPSETSGRKNLTEYATRKTRFYKDFTVC